MSSANPKVHEPSMEEILASIRRIISDDQEGLRGSLSPVGSDRDETGPEDAVDREEPSAIPEGDIQAHGSQPANDSGPEQPVSERSDPNQPAPPAPELRLAPHARQNQYASSLTVQDPASEPATDTLLSDAVSASLLNAFGRLEPNVQIGSVRTLEDLVQDMLRPMLKAWMDENLSPLVERLIQAEIQRITRGRR